MTRESDTLDGSEENQIESNAEEPTILIDAVDAVGQISPAVLIAGVLIGLILFLVIAGALLGFIFSGGFGLVVDIPDEPIGVDFESEANALWQSDSITAREEGTLYFTQQAVFEEGAYRLFNNEPSQIYWTTADVNLGTGVYVVDVTFEQVKKDTGAGLLFLAEGEGADAQFYLFQIDPNGFAWIGRCEAGCATPIPLTGGGWYTVDVIKTGANETNRLKVDVKQNQMTFFVNDFEIGKVKNIQISGWGNVGFLVESGAEGAVSAEFDDFLWTPAGWGK